MARIRSVKPELRTSLTAAQWPREVRYFWVLLWGYLDDHGYGQDEPRIIRGDCFPMDDDLTASDIDKWLDMIAHSGSLCRFTGPDGRRYIHAPKWAENQRPQHPNPPRFPECKSSHETFMNGSHENFMKDVSGNSHEISKELAINAGQPGDGESHETLTPEGEGKGNSRGKGEVAERAREQRTKPAATLLANSLLDEHRRLVAAPLPRDVVRMTGEAIDSLLDDPGITPEEIQAGLAKLRANPRLGPKTLPVLVNEVRQLAANPDADARLTPRQQADMAIRQRALNRARARDAQERRR